MNKLMKGFKRHSCLVMATLLTVSSTIASASISSPSPSKEEVSTMKKIVGYYPEWAVYSAHKNYNPDDMAISKMTHINYAFATITEGKIAVFDSWAATGITSQFGEVYGSEYSGVLGQFKKLEQAYPNTSFMISIGGWTQSGNFHDVAATADARKKFVDSVIEYVRLWSFDGVDIDWEFPGLQREPDLVDNANDQGTPKGDDSEKETFTLLLKDLRAALDIAGAEDNTYYQLTAAVSANSTLIEKTDPVEYSKYLDFINIMTYDLHGAWDTKTNHQSALYTNPHANTTALSIDASVKIFTQKGIDVSKLVIGSPFYSRGWKDVNKQGPINKYPGLFSTADGGANGMWVDRKSTR